ncbi:MAG: type pilus assembly protein PilA [Thermosipho sp. (in: thermotogales)]|nr:type pilus assembly protein PilA [Thermosipho sp. (in: thermotogales)]
MKMRKGFTLIELLIVLAIIAALMAVVTPIALNAVKKAKATQVAENFRNIKSAVEAYVNVEQEVPTTLASLTSSGYLSNAPSGFDLAGDTSFTSGVAYATVVYTSGDVSLSDLQKVYPEISSYATTANGTKYPVLSLNFQKWW